MFFHRKDPIHIVKVDKPNPLFAQLLLEQFGGATGELKAALQYWVQSFHVEEQGIKDMLQDIAIEEFGHLEMVGKLIEYHTKDQEGTAAWNSSLFAVRGMGPHFLDSQGSCWTAAYIDEGGHVVRDLRANIGAEAGARQMYEALLKLTDDEGTKKTLVHLLTREISHTEMFMKALDSLGKLDEPLFGSVEPDSTVDLYFNLSKGSGKSGTDARGPWNKDLTFVDNPEPMGDTFISGLEKVQSGRAPNVENRRIGRPRPQSQKRKEKQQKKLKHFHPGDTAGELFPSLSAASV